MRKVVVDKEDLLETVRENRERHEEIYEEACEKYCEDAARLFREKVEACQSGTVVSPKIDLSKPEEYLDDYDQAIEMLEMDERDQIDLTEDEYQKLVKDEWGWSRRFQRHTSSKI